MVVEDDDNDDGSMDDDLDLNGDEEDGDADEVFRYQRSARVFRIYEREKHFTLYEIHSFEIRRADNLSKLKNVIHCSPVLGADRLHYYCTQ